ncbi:MAG: zeta toxin family protein [Coriobacteriia bacterium]|nr:zeta toxin family protein [Coriobacteriia bacterium]
MTDQEILAHIELIRSLSTKGCALHDLAPTATIHNPKWFGSDGIIEKDRSTLHAKLLNAQPSCAKVSCEAILLAGPPGAGKSTLVQQLLGEKYESYQVIDPDIFKPLLLQEALSDGSYETFIKPAEIKKLEAKGHSFYPMELASLVHQESSIIAQRQRSIAIRAGRNIIIDTVLAYSEFAKRLVKILENNNYHIRLVDVEAAYDVAFGRMTNRCVQAYRETLETSDGLGGRWVPSEFVRSIYQADGKSVSECIAKEVAKTSPAVLRYQVFRTPQIDAEPILELDRSRKEPGGVLI